MLSLRKSLTFLLVLNILFLSACSRDNKSGNPGPIRAEDELFCEEPIAAYKFLDTYSYSVGEQSGTAAFLDGDATVDPIVDPADYAYTVQLPYLSTTYALSLDWPAVTQEIVDPDDDSEEPNRITVPSDSVTSQGITSIRSFSVVVDGESQEANSPVFRSLTLDQPSDTVIVTVKATIEIPADRALCELADGKELQEIEFERRYEIVFEHETSLLDPILHLPGTVSQDDKLGHAVANSDRHLAMSALGDDSAQTGIIALSDFDGSNAMAPESGAVYVFNKGSGETFVFKAPNAEANDRFGYAVALDKSGGTLAISAPGEDSLASGVNGTQLSNLAPESGAVYVYEYLSDVQLWEFVAYIKPPVNSTGVDGYNDYFGYRVLLDGDVLLVSAIKEDSAEGAHDDASKPDSGAVYVYERVNDVWTYRRIIKANNADAGDLFGSSLASYEQRVIIGAPGEDSGFAGLIELNDSDESDAASLNNSVADSGAVYLFERFGANQRPLYAKSLYGGAGDLFGSSVGLWDSLFFVGSPQEDGNGVGFNRNPGTDSLPNSGSVSGFRYETETARWQEFVYIKSQQPSAAAQFGFALSLFDDSLIIGEPFSVDGLTGTQGRLHVLHGLDGEWEFADSPDLSSVAVFDGSSAEIGSSVSLYDYNFAFGAPGLNVLTMGAGETGAVIVDF